MLVGCELMEEKAPLLSQTPVAENASSCCFKTRGILNGEARCYSGDQPSAGREGEAETASELSPTFARSPGPFAFSFSPPSPPHIIIDPCLFYGPPTTFDPISPPIDMGSRSFVRSFGTSLMETDRSKRYEDDDVLL